MAINFGRIGDIGARLGEVPLGKRKKRRMEEGKEKKLGKRFPWGKGGIWDYPDHR